MGGGGTGSFGAGLTSQLVDHGELVVEVDRPKRPTRRNSAKSDVLDATRVAREVLAREHLAQPRARGDRKAMRVLLATRRCAVDARTKSINQLKALIVSAHQRCGSGSAAAAPPRRSAAAPAFASTPSTASSIR